MKTNAYVTGARMVLRGVNVISVVGTTVRVMGGPSCLQDPNEPPVYCGAMVPDVAVSFAGAPAVPRYGEIINLYGVQGASTMTANGHVVTGFCDPNFC